jgi:hypothetical protein
MSLERYEIKIPSQRVAFVDLADAADQDVRFAAIVKALRRLGASPITKHTFVLPAEDSCSIAELEIVLAELTRGGDQILVFANLGQRVTVTALICANTKEGISVRRPEAGAV